jgi:hypothetical protein
MVEAHPVRVEPVIGRRHRPQAEQRLPRIMTTPPKRILKTSAAEGPSSGGDATATWKPSRLV